MRGRGLAYPARLRTLTAARLALWDVLRACARSGSLDSAIRDEQANDFADFLAAHPGIAGIFFNGAKAEQAFLRHVLPRLGTAAPSLCRLPSTSPANAGMAFAHKLELWRAVADVLRLDPAARNKPEAAETHGL